MLEIISGVGWLLVVVGVWGQSKKIRDTKEDISRLSYENTCRAADIRALANCSMDENRLRISGQEEIKEQINRLSRDDRAKRAILALEEEKDLTKAKFERLNGIVEKVNSLQGLMTKTIITSKVAAKQAQTAFDLGNEAVLRVGALEKSTHKIQLMPLDQMLARNKAMETKANKVFNPENEINDYLDNGILDGLLGDEKLDV